MSLYSAMISVAQARGFMPLALDFTDFDLNTSTVANLTTDSGADVFPSIQSAGAITSIGLTQDGGQPYFNKDDIPRELFSGIVWIGRPSQASASSLFRQGFLNNVNDFFEIALDQNLVPKAGNPYRNSYLNGTVPLSTDDLSVIIFSYDGANGPFLLYGTLDTPLTRIEGSVYRDSYDTDEFFYSENFVGEVGLIIGLGSGYNEPDIQVILASFDSIGRLTLPTNLPADRTQGISVVEANGKVEVSLILAEGETEFSAYLTTKTGDPVKFVAFDSTPALDIYQTNLVDPQTLSEISFFMGATDSTQSSKVSGIVQIDGSPAQRTVRAFGYNPTVHDLNATTVNLSKSLGHSTSDPDTGDYTIDLLAGYGQEIFVVAFDDYGAPFTPAATLAVGNRIHPTTPNGHVWECIGAGALPADEPTWVVDTETSQLYGTASMIARPFYRPMVHGPIMPEVSGIEAVITTLHIAGTGFSHSAVLKQDGTVEVWGSDYWSQVSDLPAGLSGVKSVACGGYFTVALKEDGSLVAWGGTTTGESSVPTTGTYVQVAGGHYHGAAIREDGQVVTWGRSSMSIPAIVGTVGAKFIEGWGAFFIVVLNDGTAVLLGSGVSLPSGLAGVKHSGGGRDHAYVAFDDGTIQGFGSNAKGQLNTPAGFGDCRQIAGGRWHTVALTYGGTISHWGDPNNNLNIVPTGADFIALYSGSYHCIAVREDGTVVGWGSTANGVSTVPPGLIAKIP